MRIKTLVPAIAIVLAATVGSAYAAERFNTLEGIAAQALTPQEMAGYAGLGNVLVTLEIIHGNSRSNVAFHNGTPRELHNGDSVEQHLFALEHGVDHLVNGVTIISNGKRRFVITVSGNI